MDYSKLSDFEINKRVFESKTSLAALSYPHSADKRSCGYKDINDIYHWFDFCNNPADSWPIIVGNEISLISRCANGEWKAQLHLGREDIFDSYASCWDKNPLRAAMITFLMMQEAK
ncbi:TPA: phage protein NinX family protein [Klebsiella aerogenes]